MNIEIEKKQKRRISNSFFNTLATNKRYILIVIIEITLFFLYYYIVSPSNFSSFSDTLRYFISALGTLLAVVVPSNDPTFNYNHLLYYLQFYVCLSARRICLFAFWLIYWSITLFYHDDGTIRLTQHFVWSAAKYNLLQSTRSPSPHYNSIKISFSAKIYNTRWWHHLLLV